METTYRFSRLPNPTRQKPNAQMAPTAPKMIAPEGPFVGKLRLYLIGLNPPDGGKSLGGGNRDNTRLGQTRRACLDAGTRGRRGSTPRLTATHCLYGRDMVARSDAGEGELRPPELTS